MAKATKKSTTATTTAAAAPKAKKVKAAKKATGPLASMKALVKEAAKAATKTKGKNREKPAYKTRIAEVHARKEKVVASIVDQLVRTGEDAGELKTRLVKASNAQLLRLERAAADAKKAGGRSKIVTTIATSLGRTKDKDYLKKLEGFPLPKLLDLLKTSGRRAAASK